jgi:DNA modification methylase
VIWRGDCLQLMRALKDASVDAIVCDPPYGLEFMGKNWDHGIPGAPFWAEALRVAKPGAHLLAFGGTRTFHRLACAIEDAGWEIRDCLSWLYGSGFPKSHNGSWGGTALKPAWEPIILARKPLVGTVAENVTEWGTGALNIAACRIGTDSVRTRGRSDALHGRSNSLGAAWSGNCDESERTGRWPANLVLDEEAAALLDAQSGERKVGWDRGRPPRQTGSVYGAHRDTPFTGHADVGGASRFFYCAKASRAEREAGLEGAPAKPGHAYNHRPSGGLNAHLHGADPSPSRNHHPTVKPVALMRWLVRLVTPPNGLVLDPFAGSGTTGIACILDGFRFLGMERDLEYTELGRRRIRSATLDPAAWLVFDGREEGLESDDPEQPDLFGAADVPRPC